MRLRHAYRLVTVLALVAGAPGCTFEPRSVSIPEGGTSVPLSLTDHQPGVDVTFDGRGPFRVLVDTGATPALAVTPKLAAELGLRRQFGFVRLRAANGKWVRAARASVRSLRLGDAEFRDVPAVILDIGEENFVGVLGMGLFSRGVVTFDFPGRRLSLRRGALDADDPDTFGAPFVYGIPMVPVSAPLRDNGIRDVHVLLDTGSNGGMVLPASLRDALDTDPAVSGRAVADTLGGTREIELVKLRGQLVLGRFRAADRVVGLAPGRGSIGTPALREFEVSVDQRSKRVRLRLAPESAAR